MKRAFEKNKINGTDFFKKIKTGNGTGFDYACKKCDFKAKLRNSMIFHINFHHRGLRYNCDQCEYKASSITTLNRHYNNQHEGSGKPLEYETSFVEHNCEESNCKLHLILRVDVFHLNNFLPF